MKLQLFEIEDIAGTDFSKRSNDHLTRPHDIRVPGMAPTKLHSSSKETHQHLIMKLGRLNGR